jgi:hypothetical protein
MRVSLSVTDSSRARSCSRCAAPILTDHRHGGTRCTRHTRQGASFDRHGASSCGSGGSAAVGRPARSTGAPPPAGSCPTETPLPPGPPGRSRWCSAAAGMHAAGMHLGCLPTDRPGTPGLGPRPDCGPRRAETAATRRPAELLERPAGAMADGWVGTEHRACISQEVGHGPANCPCAAARAGPAGVAVGIRLPRRPRLEILTPVPALQAHKETETTGGTMSEPSAPATNSPPTQRP